MWSLISHIQSTESTPGRHHCQLKNSTCVYLSGWWELAVKGVRVGGSPIYCRLSGSFHAAPTTGGGSGWALHPPSSAQVPSNWLPDPPCGTLGILLNVGTAPLCPCSGGVLAALALLYREEQSLGHRGPRALPTRL